MNREPFTELQEAAVNLHEMYLTFVQAGFTERQALYLISKVLTTKMDGPEDADPGD